MDKPSKLNERLALLLLALLVVGCGSDRGPTEPPQPFEGTWVWGRSECGIAGEVCSPDTKGISVRLEYGDSRVRAFLDGSLVDETEYEASAVPTNGPLPAFEIRYTTPLQALPFAQFDEQLVHRIAPTIARSRIRAVIDGFMYSSTRGSIDSEHS